jgi:AraC-like DNA-binding protein
MMNYQRCLRSLPVVSVSEAHSIRTFRATFGETPHRYLQRRRLERSMFLLRETDRSVTEICLDVGFTSLGTFSRTFRDIVGVSPIAYRRGSAPVRGAVPTSASRWPGCARAVSEKLAGRAPDKVGAMKNFNAITHAHVWVLNHQEALDFYVGKLGLEVKADAGRPRLRKA